MLLFVEFIPATTMSLFAVNVSEFTVAFEIVHGAESTLTAVQSYGAEHVRFNCAEYEFDEN